MPSWRTSLYDATLPAGGTEMDALLVFLENIQVRRFGVDEGPTRQDFAAAGKLLFKSHCVVCHGEGGRGPTPSGYVVGVSIDLTMIARRNGGLFDGPGVYEAIAGHDNGKSTNGMPAWMRSFRKAGWDDYQSMKDIEALVTYLESLQR